MPKFLTLPKTIEGKYLKDDGTWGAPSASAAWGGITGTLSAQTDLNTSLSGKAAASHAHAASDITGTAVLTNDARLSDARTPSSHSHIASEITGTAVLTNDSRLSDARALAAGADKTKLDGIAAGAVADHVNIANKGSNTHAQIDTFVSSKASASGLASLDANSQLAQGLPRTQDGLLYAALANDTLAQAYATNSCTRVAITASRTFTTTVPAAGCFATTIISSNGAWTVTFGSGFKPTATLVTASGKLYVMSWISNGTNLYEAGRTVAMTP